MGVSAVFVTADTLAIGPIMEAIGQPMSTAEIFDAESVREMGRAIIGAAIWIPYAIVSRRVNVTYRNRVRPDDPLIQKSTAAVF